MRTALVGAVRSTQIALEALIAAGHPPLALFTLPPERASRHSDYVDLEPVAARAGVDLIHTANINAPDVLARLQEMDTDYAFVIGWSQLCGAELLSCARGGTIGYHPAALPRNRGRAVIPWTIIQGLPDTGSTLFWIDEGVDSGDVLAQEIFAVVPDETAASLYEKHMNSLGRMLSATIPQLAAGNAPRTRQEHSMATYCARRTMRDGWINWERSAREIWTLIRACGDPYPGAFTMFGETKLTIWAAEYVGQAPYVGLPGQVQALSSDGALVQCGDGEHVLVKTIQVDNGPRVAAVEALRNHDRLGTNPWDQFLKTRIVTAGP